MTQTYFITATGTDIGKTYVAKALFSELQGAGKKTKVIKPVVSGYDINNNNDLNDIVKLLDGKYSAEDISCYRLKEPLSPDMAARAEGVMLDYLNVLRFCQRACVEDYLLIEGVGGVMVPLTESHTVLDLMADLQFTTLLVAGTYLGTLSHTLTALHALQSRKVPVKAIILNESAGENNPSTECTIATLKNFTDVPIIALSRNGQHLWEDLQRL